MDEHQLRSRLTGVDPLADGPDIDPITSDRARALLEETMKTPVAPLPDRRSASPGPRRWVLIGSAAALVGALAIGGALLNRNDDSPVASQATATTAPAKLKVLELSTGTTDPSMMSCLPVSAESVAMAPIAFRAVVDTADGDIVTMTIDRWYRGGDAQAVTLTAPSGMEALIGGIEFTPGEAVLVTAYDGVVNYCGMSGPATPELQAIFDEAFPS
jgi:hypothetical protein